MKLATFNANSIRSRMPIVSAWLQAHQPEVLCVQETKVQDADFPLAELAAVGYQAAFRGEKSYNGVALLFKQAPRKISFGLDDGGPADETRFIRADWDGFSVVNTYVPQGRELDHPMYQYKLEWFRRLRAYFDRRFKPTDKLLWAGDLNVAAEPMDVHDSQNYTEHVCFHADVRRAFAECRSWGFADVFRQFHPEPKQYTFFDYRTINAVKRGIGWRIDYLLASPALATTCRACEIDLQPRLMDKPSDHTFLWADFAV